MSVVAEEDGSLVGMVGGDFRPDDRTVHLVALWVDPAARERGVGRALVDALVVWARERGAGRVELWVVDDNPAAAAVYESAGPQSPEFAELSNRMRTIGIVLAVLVVVIVFLMVVKPG